MLPDSDAIGRVCTLAYKQPFHAAPASTGARQSAGLQFDRGKEKVELLTDAAGRKGFVAVLGTPLTAARRSASWQEGGITKITRVLEFFPIANRQITLLSINHEVFQALNLGAARCHRGVSLPRHLTGCQLKDNIEVKARHILRYDNSAADALSRFQWQRFRELAPHVYLCMTQVPQQLWKLVEEP
ncbi:hypothetical protein NDU88_001782 [Pleurodeles waltl]|uniref:Uncharacterized protein n=1 Tax=Pleurodeles waltl TaxID=8319 RepID=A0AAV7V9E9_PLEWA|nr:hypothetical protein NDU88_001782 [Pleurodeles waltl]